MLSVSDLIAGLCVAGLLLPEAVAYAGIAGLEPQHALFAAIAGLVVYAIFGQSRFAIVAPTSSSAAIIAAAAAFMSSDLEPAQRVSFGVGVVVLTGFFFVAAGVARLGHLSNFISRPVLRGFAFGLAIVIVSKQLPALLGIRGISGATLEIWVETLRKFSEWNIVSLAIGIVSLVILIGLRRFPTVPAAFLVLAAGIVLSFAVNLAAYRVSLIGKIDLEPVIPSLPRLTLTEWTRLAEIALPLFLIIFAESWGAMRNLALRHGDTVDANRELVALGAANLMSGLIRGMPVGAGFSASSANETAGAQSRFAGLIAAASMVVLLAIGGKFIARLPEPVLAAVVISALLHSLDPAPLIRFWRINRDQYIAAAAAAGVILSGVVDGMIVAVALSIVALLQRLSRPTIAVLGRLGDTHDFVDIKDEPNANFEPSIPVLRPSQPLFFANAEVVLGDVARAGAESGVRAIILSMEESSDLDSTAVDALVECEARLTSIGRKLYLARIKQEIRELLATAGAADLASGGRCFWSVATAFDYAMREVGPAASCNPKRQSAGSLGGFRQ
ncbi:MAG TPA: SulP family inorganic anion transporter [Pseudolabrys sp.]|nr:SulP family inorganic anion transporter [Pseudolabrys sp.]